MAFIQEENENSFRKAKLLEEIKVRQPRKRGDELSALGAKLGHLAGSGGLTRRDFERMIGRNDLMPINYLERGLLAASSVGRIDVREPFGGGGSWGTGFLVGPGLMLTNSHVIGTIDEARNSTIEFGYERDAKGEFRTSRRFRLEPDLLFLTSPANELDFTLVGVSKISIDGSTTLDSFAFLRLNPSQHKIEEGEFVTIIQHPEGAEKYIAIRENKVVQIGNGDGLSDDFLWYNSDTAPGSSGSPVFNDAWQVVALHHKGIPVYRQDNGYTEYQLVTGEWVRTHEAEQLPDDRLRWVANEGVRISRIVNTLRVMQKKERSSLLQDLVDDIDGVRPFAGRHGSDSIVTSQPSTDVAPVDVERSRQPRRNVRPLSYYQDRKGYDPSFLGNDNKIPLPTLTQNALRFGNIANVDGSEEGELRYEHFSVVFNADRKQAFFTAVNIDGNQSISLDRGSDKWYYDPRLPLEIQVGDELYSKEPGGNYFDRGHLVRRLDPVWGSQNSASIANEDTFHWTNCSPQYWQFNQRQEWWQGLENYILNNTDQDNLLATVFTGPLFQDDDEIHRGVKIPQAFWKVVVVADNNGKIYSSAYLVSQKQYAKNIPFERLPVGQHNGFQLSILRLEQLTGLSFGNVVGNADVYEGGLPERAIRGLADIQHPRRFQKTRRTFGRFENFSTFLKSYVQNQLVEEAKEEHGLDLEERRRRMRRRRERDVVEIEAVVAEYLGTETSGDSHQHVIINVRRVLQNDPDVIEDIERVRTNSERVFVSIRFGDHLGLSEPVPGLAQGIELRLRGEWITRERAYSHGGERMSVLHFTHHPIGFVCNHNQCWE